MKRLLGLLIAVMTMLAAACTSTNPSTASSQIAESPTASESAAGPTSTPLPESGDISPGTYVTDFKPKMAFTAADTGWEVDVDTPGWVGMEFPLSPPTLGTFGVVAVAKVFDPEHHGKIIDPPKDLAGWIAHLPGLKVVAPPTPVTVGGSDGEQLDVVIGPENVEVGPIPGTSDPHNGFPKDQAVRIIVVTVDGQDVEISYAPDEGGSRNFKEAVKFAQPLIDSITWG